MSLCLQVLSYLIIAGFTYFWLWYLTWERSRYRSAEGRKRRQRWWERDIRWWRK